MPSITELETQAILAAKNGDWLAALSINQNILHDNPHNIGALNRSGVAYLQLKKIKKATEVFLQVLQLEKSNSIASKQLANIKKRHIKTPQFNSENFVEEPSKSKIIGLHRLAHKLVLEKLVVGQELNLKPKSRFISIVTLDQTYLGSLPEDISLHLSFLIKRGNHYSCQLHSASNKHCTVFIKETHQAPENRHYHSFSSNYQPEKDEAIGEDLLLLADEAPLNIIGSDPIDDTDPYQDK